nr:MAG TPA: Regulatory protein [Caudoviricetes sp.]
MIQLSIAENIKKIRLEHELSQADLGRIAGVSDKGDSIEYR